MWSLLRYTDRRGLVAVPVRRLRARSCRLRRATRLVVGSIGLLLVGCHPYRPRAVRDRWVATSPQGAGGGTGVAPLDLVVVDVGVGPISDLRPCRPCAGRPRRCT